MAPEPAPPAGGLLQYLLVPVATVEDARSTARALVPYTPDRLTVLHVVEKGDGVTDKTPVEQSEDLAKEASTALRQTFPDAEGVVAYRQDVVGTIHDVAEEIHATGIAVQSRASSRIGQFLSGDRSLRLITESARPAIASPTEAAE